MEINVRNLKGTFRFLGAKKVNSLLIDGTKVAPKNKMSFNDILAELRRRNWRISWKILVLYSKEFMAV
nr:hypothetical protein [Mycoplasmopsis bovis]